MIIIHPSYEHYADFINNLPTIFLKEGETIYKARNEVKLFCVNGKELIVKSFQIPHFVNRFVYAHLRSSKAERSYTNSMILLEKGIDTPQPVAYIEIIKNGLLLESYYVSEKSPYDREFREISNSPVTEKSAPVLIQFAAFTASLHEKNVYHKDFTPGNVLFGEKNGSYLFQLIDVNRMKIGPVDMQMGCKNFYNLYMSDIHFSIVARHYAQVRGFDPGECEKLVLKYRLLPQKNPLNS